MTVAEGVVQQLQQTQQKEVTFWNLPLSIPGWPCYMWKQNLKKIIIINAYAPTEGKDDFTKDQFHNKLEQIYDTTWENDTHGCLQIIWHLMKQIIFL